MKEEQVNTPVESAKTDRSNEMHHGFKVERSRRIRKTLNKAAIGFFAAVPVLAAFVVISQPSALADKIKLGAKIPPLSLQDWEGKTYTLKSFKEPVLAIWYEGRNSLEQNRWLKNELAELVDKKVIPREKFRSVGIANFQETAIPNVLIARHIRAETKRTGALILCDRDGRMQKEWGFRNGRSNIYILDKNRRLRWRTSGPLNKRRGQQLIRLIQRLMRE